jgi:hypothetical protein
MLYFLNCSPSGGAVLRCLLTSQVGFVQLMWTKYGAVHRSPYSKITNLYISQEVSEVKH